MTLLSVSNNDNGDIAVDHDDIVDDNDDIAINNGGDIQKPLNRQQGTARQKGCRLSPPRLPVILWFTY